MDKDFYVIAFETTHYAIMAEKKLKEKFKIQMIPTPRVITASCGLSVKVPGDDINDILHELKTWDVDFDLMDVYRIQKEKGRDLSTQIEWKN